MTDLVIRPTDDVGIDLPQLGQLLAKSGYFADARDAAQCVVKVLAGRELGIGPIAAMTGIYLVKGRVTMSANLMAAQIKRSGRYTYSVAQMSNEACELVFHERDAGGWREIGRSAFTADDAKLAGLWNSSDPWKKTPRNMLFARAMSNGAKWFCPDIFAGPVYTPDELSDAAPVTAIVVDTSTGEVLAPAPQTFERGEIGGAAEAVENAYSKSGKLTLRFRLMPSGHTVLYVGAPELAAQLESGDAVIVTGEIRMFKGEEVIAASSVAHADGPGVWEARAARPSAIADEYDLIDPPAAPAPVEVAA